MPDSEDRTLTHSSAANEDGGGDESRDREGDEDGDGDEAAGDEVAVAESGSHWELAAVSTAAAAVAADADGIPCVLAQRPQPREPPNIRQAAATRTCATGIGVWPFALLLLNTGGGRRPRKRLSSSTVILPGILSGYSSDSAIQTAGTIRRDLICVIRHMPGKPRYYLECVMAVYFSRAVR